MRTRKPSATAWPATLWTIGHSTRSLDEFIALLGRNDIAALADYFGVPVMSLLDDTLMRQMLGERNLGASLVAATTARFPVRAAEGQADGLKPLETKNSEPRYLVEPGAGEYPQRESNSRCQIESLVS